MIAMEGHESLGFVVADDERGVDAERRPDRAEHELSDGREPDEHEREDGHDAAAVLISDA